MKILFVHEVGYLEKPIFEMHEFPEHLAKLGHDVAFIDFPELSNPSIDRQRAEEVNGRVLTDITLKLFHHSVGVQNMFGRLLAVFSAPFFVWKVIREFKPEVIVSYAVPTSGWQALIVARLRGIPYLFRALDVSHKIRQTRFSAAVLVAEKFIYRNADWISCNNPSLRRYCLEHGGSEEKSSIDLPLLDLALFRPTSKTDPASHSEPFSGRLIIAYMGSFFYFSGLEDVIKSLVSFPNVTLVLVGGGEQEQTLKALVTSLGLNDRVDFRGFVEYRDLPTVLSQADILINPMEPSLVSNAALPNKVLQYMALGLPVVTTRLEGLSSLFPNEQGLFFAESSSEVVRIAADLYESGLKNSLGKGNRLAVENLFTHNDLVRAFESRLVRMVGKHV